MIYQLFVIVKRAKRFATFRYTMNRLGNFHSSDFADSYQYVNADGSKYISNPDGSAYYDPGTSRKGKKWYQDPDGVKHYISDTDSDDTMYLGSSRMF